MTRLLRWLLCNPWWGLPLLLWLWPGPLPTEPLPPLRPPGFSAPDSLCITKDGLPTPSTTLTAEDERTAADWGMRITLRGQTYVRWGLPVRLPPGELVEYATLAGVRVWTLGAQQNPERVYGPLPRCEQIEYRRERDVGRVRG